MSSHNQERMTNLKEQIIEAFRDVPYPGDDNLVDKDPGGFNIEEEELEERFRGKHWQALTLATLHNSGDSFFTPAAYHFFLPAYLLVSLSRFYEADVLPYDTVCGLDPMFNAECGRMRKFRKTQGLFTKTQRNVIRSFLEFLRDEYGEEFENEFADYELDRLIEFYSEDYP